MSDSLEKVFSDPALPFHVGLFAEPHNPEGLPDTLPFELVLDRRSGALTQSYRAEVASHLERAYALGSLLGTAMDETAFGVRYAEDFLGFIRRCPGSLEGRRSLEIGAGRGYLVRRLGELGVDALGIEPGAHNETDWERHGARVVHDTFPSRQISGRFDWVLAYGVLEHIHDVGTFLDAVRRVLSDEGLLVLGVPNCEPYLDRGDPSTLTHQHYQYFTALTLRRLLETHGFEAVTSASADYGGVLYIAARARDVADLSGPADDELERARRFGHRCGQTREAVRAHLRRLELSGDRLGVYCPSRAMNVLPTQVEARFFDDDAEFRGRFIPPFAAPVESRADLIADPVSEVWIMSTTFGEAIRSSLREHPELAAVRVRTLSELLT